MSFQIFHFALFILTDIAFLLGLVYYKIYSQFEIKKVYFIFIELLLITLFAPFIPFLTSLFFVIEIIRISYLLRLKGTSNDSEMMRDEFKENKKTNFKLILSKIFFIIYTLILGAAFVFLLLVYILVIIARFWGFDWYYILSSVIGITLALFYLKKNNINQIHFYSSPQTLKPFLNSSNKTKASIIIISLMFTSVFINIGLDISSNRFRAIDNGVEVKAMTYNILYKGFDGTIKDWEYRKPYVIDLIEEENPDIFGIQEGWINQIEYLKENLTNRNYTWYGQGRDGFEHTGEHTAIFFDEDKYDLIDNGTFWLSPTPEKPSIYITEPIWRIASWVHLREISSNSEFFFYNTHFGFYPEFHIRASMLLNNHISENTGELPVILTGDFNMPNFFPFYLFLEEWGNKPLKEAYRIRNYLVNPFDGTTASGCFVDPPLSSHIDYIFVSEEIEVKSCEIVRYSYDETHSPSDHHPVTIELEFPISN